MHSGSSDAARTSDHGGFRRNYPTRSSALPFIDTGLDFWTSFGNSYESCEDGGTSEGTSGMRGCESETDMWTSSFLEMGLFSLFGLRAFLKFFRSGGRGAKPYYGDLDFLFSYIYLRGSLQIRKFFQIAALAVSPPEGVFFVTAGICRLMSPDLPSSLRVNFQHHIVSTSLQHPLALFSVSTIRACYPWMRLLP